MGSQRPPSLWTLSAPCLQALGSIPPTNRLSTALPQGSVSMVILDALWVVDACSLSDFFILNEIKKKFAQNWGGWVGQGRVQKKKNLEFSRFSGWVGLKKSIFQI